MSSPCHVFPYRKLFMATHLQCNVLKSCCINVALDLRAAGGPWSFRVRFDHLQPLQWCWGIIRDEQMQKHISPLFYIATPGTLNKAYVNRYNCETFSSHCAVYCLSLGSSSALLLELSSTLPASQTLQMEEHMKRLLLPRRT